MIGLLEKVNNKIQYLREQPEQTRFRAASYLTLVTAAIVSILWLAILLPAQIYLNKEDQNSESISNQEPPAQQVQGIFNEPDTETLEDYAHQNLQVTEETPKTATTPPANQPLPTP
jgi:hypothetical protein